MNNKKTFYAALGHNVFVKEIKQENKINGLLIPDSIDSDFTYGEVISCSDGYFDNGSFVSSNITIGDVVAFPKVSGTKMTLAGNDFIRVFAENIIAKRVEGEILNNGDNK